MAWLRKIQRGPLRYVSNELKDSFKVFTEFANTSMIANFFLQEPGIKWFLLFV
jgi:hypothetical protein